MARRCKHWRVLQSYKMSFTRRTYFAVSRQATRKTTRKNKTLYNYQSCKRLLWLKAHSSCLGHGSAFDVLLTWINTEMLTPKHTLFVNILRQNAVKKAACFVWANSNSTVFKWIVQQTLHKQKQSRSGKKIYLKEKDAADTHQDVDDCAYERSLFFRVWQHTGAVSEHCRT